MAASFFRTSFRIVPLAALALLLPLVASAQKIHIHYDKSADFSSFKTFNWAPQGAIAHPMLAADVIGAIEDELSARGLQKSGDNPDLIIQVYGSVDQDSTFYSNDPLYMASGGIPPFDPSFSGPAFVGDWGNTTVTIHKGELVVDLIHAKKLVWRAMGNENISQNNPDKLISQVNGMITKMFKEYPVSKQ